MVKLLPLVLVSSVFKANCSLSLMDNSCKTSERYDDSLVTLPKGKFGKIISQDENSLHLVKTSKFAPDFEGSLSWSSVSQRL